MASTQLTNLQQELLKIYSTNIDDQELIEVKQMLGNYFAKKAIEKADKVWDEKGLTDDDMDTWLNEG